MDNSASVSGPSAKLMGVLQTADAQSNYTIALPITGLDIVLPSMPSPGQVSLSPVPTFDPTGWPSAAGAEILEYQITVPFDDTAGVLDWSQPFTTPSVPSLTCQGATKPLATASWVPGSLSVNRDAKTVQMQLGYIFFTSREALDVYTKDWKNASTCTVSFVLDGPQASSSIPLSFSIDTAKTGNGPLFFPKTLPPPHIQVIGPAGAPIAGDSTSPVQLPGATVSVPYSSQTSTVKLSVTGGLGPYTWLWDNLPPGLDQLKVTDGYGSLIPITGTLGVPGTYALNAQVTDKAQQVATQPVTLTVGPALAVTTAQLSAGRVGAPYSVGLQAVGGVPGYHWKLKLGPPMPVVSVSDDGTVTFSAPAAGTVTFAVQVSDSASPAHNASATFDITVGP